MLTKIQDRLYLDLDEIQESFFDYNLDMFFLGMKNGNKFNCDEDTGNRIVDFLEWHTSHPGIKEFPK